MQFKNVIGQRLLKNQLIKEVKEDKISHAQLFLGKAGYGSLPLALAFVQYIFCENKQADDSCGVCPSCRKVSALQHPDLHFSFPLVLSINKTSNPFLPEWRETIASNAYFSSNDWNKAIDSKVRSMTIGTDESQEIIKKLNLKSFEGGYKVMIIWMAEMMNPTCANKLLKILEEPPARTLFILVSETQDSLLQTILSRTQIVKIPRINIDDLSDYLRKCYDITNEKADSLAARADGDFLEVQEELNQNETQDINRDLFIELMRACYKRKVLEMLEWSEKVNTHNKEAQKAFLKYALHMFRQSMLKNYTDDQLTRVSSLEDDFLKNFSKFITGNNILPLMELFDKSYYELERNANSKILFTTVCFNVMRYLHAA